MLYLVPSGEGPGGGLGLALLFCAHRSIKEYVAHIDNGRVLQMNTKEFYKYLQSIFRFKRRKAEELINNEKEMKASLERVRARVLERLKKNDLPEHPDVDY